MSIKAEELDAEVISGQSERASGGFSVTEQYFMRRVCCQISVQTPKAEDGIDRCGCGRRVDDHKYAGNLPRGAPNTWRVDRNTKEFPTDAFGVIEFQGGPHPSKAQYLRLSFDSKPEDVLQLMEKQWKLGRPKLVISVHGSLDNFELPPKLAKVFGTGLMKAARTTGAWFICSGMDTGVGTHVAAAFSSATSTKARTRKRPVLIGIMPWGMLKNRDDFLISKCKDGRSCKLPSKDAAETVEGATVLYHSRGHYHPHSNYAVLLDSCTHLLLVDDGSTHRYGADIVLRRRLEEYISQQALLAETGNKKNVPVVGILLKGGVASLRTVLDYVTSRPSLPMVVLDNSGLAADYLGWIDRSKLPLTENQQTTAKGRIREHFRTRNDQQPDWILEQLMLIMRRKKKISVFRLSETNQDFDNAIFTALLSAQVKLSPADRLDLTLAWNRPDIAAETVFASSLTLDMSVLEARMLDALVMDRVEFVQLLLLNGVSMENFLTPQRLEYLYNKTGKTGTLLAAMKERKIKLSAVVGQRRLSDEYRLRDIGAVIRRLMGGGTYDAWAYRAGKLSPHPFDDLFIWAVLVKRHNMALWMWKNGHGPIPKALVGIKLNKSLSKEAADEPNADEMCAAFDAFAEEWQTRSLQLVNQCYRMDDDKTLQVLTREMPNWGYETCLSLAIRAGHQEFIAHPSCQLLFNDLWQGGLQIRRGLTGSVLFAIMFPPGLFLLEYKTRQELMLQAQRGEERKDNAKKAQEQSEETKPSNSFRAADEQLNCVEKIREFYSAPITKFWIWTLSYLIFLVIYSWFVLLKTPKRLDHWQEIYILAYGAVRLCEMCREIITSEPKRFGPKLNAFFGRRWNAVMFLGAATMLLIPLRRYLGVSMYKPLHAVRILYAINIIIWYSRLLELMTVHKTFGPYIIMFGETVKSFLSLAVIFAIVMTSYGVAVQSIWKPNDAEFRWENLRDSVYQPYFMMFGETFPEDIDRCGESGTYCVPGHWLLPTLQAAYHLFMNALLMNLLIATFTNIFMSIKTSSLTIWKFHRYDHIMIYEHKPLLPPPFTILGHLYALVKFLIQRCKTRGQTRVHDPALKLVLNEQQTRHILDFELEAMEEMNALMEEELASSPAECIIRSDDKSEFNSMKLDEMIARNAMIRDAVHRMEKRVKLLNKVVRKRMRLPEE